MDAIRFTTQGDYACSWCGYLIPTRKNILQEWISAEVAGMFCSESHAAAATNNATYRAKYQLEEDDFLKGMDTVEDYAKRKAEWAKRNA